jgi:biopolymer transport protein ExbD
MKFRPEAVEEPDLNVSALIDMVFLMLVYFMVAATLVRSEADLGIRLPGMLAQAESVDLTDEQMIEVRTNGRIFLNGQEFDSPESTALPQLVTTLTRYRLSAEAAKTTSMITIAAEDDSEHQRSIDVMNACAQAGLKNVTFSVGGS